VRPALSGQRPPRLRIGESLGASFAKAQALEAESHRSGRRALRALLDVGHDVVIERGVQGTRVNDVVEAAGLSHGAFYRYFKNTDEMVRVVGAHALGAVSAVLAEVPHPPERAALRRWLRTYNVVFAEHGAMIRVWSEAAEEHLKEDRAGVFDWGRRRLARLLADRPFGDPDIDGIPLLGLVEAFGAVPRGPAEVDAAVYLVERAFLGRSV
jgi:AcrR family transcriptional regulator